MRVLLEGSEFEVLDIGKVEVDKEQPKVYLELTPINKAITRITFGPKARDKRKWGAAFHYFLRKAGFRDVIVNVSTLPYQ